jgi:transglutaminase-like putative cysteine protease
MKRLTVEAIHSQLPRYAAINLISGASIGNPELFVRALVLWIINRVKVVDEFEELLISPKIMLEEIGRQGYTAGDCDDMAMLAASMLASVGADVRFRAVYPLPDGSYRHVIVEYLFPGQPDWQSIDPRAGIGQKSYPEDSLTMDVIS